MKMNKTVFDVLKRLDKKYHTDGNPEISDTEYDFLKSEAKRFDPDNPYFKTVGASVPGSKVKLPYVLGSLDKTKIDTVEDWLNKYDGPFQATEKVDGASFYVEYQYGEVITGATRGDGAVGQDITDKLKVICPHIPLAGNILFRGELVLKKNVDIAKLGFKNRRNGVVGIINRDGLDNVNFISPIFYEVLSKDGESVSPRDSEVIFSQSGLPLVKSTMFTRKFKPESLVELLAEWKEIAEYDMDGLVLAVYDAPRENIMLPETKVAFKVNEDAVPVRVRDIEWNPSRMGQIMPVVLLDPTELDGVTISRATGFNAQFIRDEVVGPGAIIGLVRSGGVIPFITEVIKPAKTIGLIDRCPSCNTKLIWSGVHLKCTNKKCAESMVYQLEHFMKLMEIESMSATTLRKLNVSTIEDLYDLTEDDIMEIEGFGYKRATEIVSQIQKSLKAKPYKLLAAFGIPLIGRTASKAIMSSYTFDQLFHLDEDTDLGLGPTISKSFFDNICTFEDTYGYLVHKGLTFEKEKKSMISGKEFALTGKGNMGRREITELIEDLGGSVKTVSKSTDYLVCEDPNSGSGKLQKAKKYGTKIISYPNLMKMLGY
jgi:NAD-dependent DNA ligase